MTEIFIACAPANSTSWEELVDVNESGVDEGGRLKGVGVAAGEVEHSMRIKIDDDVLVEDRLSQAPSGYENDGINIDLPFENKLCVEIKDDSSKARPRFWAAYLTDGSVTESDIAFTDDERVYRKKEFQTPSGKYSVKELIGSSTVSKVTLDKELLDQQESDSITGRVRTWQFSHPERADPFDILGASDPFPISDKIRDVVGLRPGMWRLTDRTSQIPLDVRSKNFDFSLLAFPKDPPVANKTDDNSPVYQFEIPLTQIDFSPFTKNNMGLSGPLSIEVNTVIESAENYPDDLTIYG